MRRKSEKRAPAEHQSLASLFSGATSRASGSAHVLAAQETYAAEDAAIRAWLGASEAERLGPALELWPGEAPPPQEQAQCYFDRRHELFTELEETVFMTR